MTATVQVRLADVLQHHHISQRRLARAADMRLATVNAIYNSKITGLEFTTLASIVAGLRRLGAEVTVGDLLEVVEQDEPKLTAAGVPYTGDAETDAILDEHPDILQRVQRLKAGAGRLIPLEELMAQFGLQE